MEWETVIGLEIHAQLATRSKIFSGASTAFGADPNANACAVDLGLPGVLPVLNAEVVRMAIKFGLATGAIIAERSVFARKNYFYPDLPKGYQISQYELPVVSDGQIEIDMGDAGSKRIGITRAHLEEDAGKSLHEAIPGCTGIDLNRAGTPLLEIVSEPDMRSASEATAYMRKVHSLVRYLDICDGNMQEGSFRCDANVSVRPSGESKLGVRTEIKNLNSFRFVERAIEYEVERQIELIEGGGTVVQETRLFDVASNQTRPMRSKEEANDYRYFPDPDLLPVVVEAREIDAIRAEMPELPDAKRSRFSAQYSLNEADSIQLTQSKALADFFEATTRASDVPAKLAANWITGEVAAALNRHDLELAQCPISPARLGGLLALIDDETISGKIAKDVFDLMWNENVGADAIIDRLGLRQVSDSDELEAIVTTVLSENADQVEQFRSGKEKVIGFFVGQVMKLTQGKANPKRVNELLRKHLAPD